MLNAKRMAGACATTEIPKRRRFGERAGGLLRMLMGFAQKKSPRLMPRATHTSNTSKLKENFASSRECCTNRARNGQFC